ncbi:telomerase-binding protein EST1A [Anopheles aquasalis]|uniref:telomerase-binding protein EST1A n=1 Tax=Anopheles aquasalis TaxID=42839 RepID=UPI00215AE077|nr:telomerase-binding protein EST1A [Anopheles aquasalis]
MSSEEPKKENKPVSYRDVGIQVEEEAITGPVADLLHPIEEFVSQFVPFIDQAKAVTVQKALKCIKSLALASDQPHAVMVRPSSPVQSNLTRNSGARSAPQTVACSSTTNTSKGKILFVRQRDGTVRVLKEPADDSTAQFAYNSPSIEVREMVKPQAPLRERRAQQRCPTGQGAGHNSNHLAPKAIVIPNLKREELPDKLQELSKQLRDMELGSDPLQRWPAMKDLRYKFFAVLLDSMCRQMTYVQQSNIENIFWREHCHRIVDRYRTRMKVTSDASEQQGLRDFLYIFIDDCREWFLFLLEELEFQYSFNLSNYIGKNAAFNMSGVKHSLALVSAQKLCLFVGDLWRYQLEISEMSPPTAETASTNATAYSEMEHYYTRARDILPKNARPYNQLATVAVRNHKFFEAVYLYSRCMAASNPSQSAWEGLLELFNVARKKFEAARAEQELGMFLYSDDDGQPEFDRMERREVWIHPGNQTGIPPRSLPMTNQPSKRSEQEDILLESLPTDKLELQFYHSFVHMVGMIATKTGMEAFTQCADQVLREFRLLLTTMLNPAVRVLEISVLLMFAKEKAKHVPKDNDAAAAESKRSPRTPSELELRAMSVVKPFIGIIIKRVLEIASLGITDWWLVNGSVQQQQQHPQQALSFSSVSSISETPSLQPQKQKPTKRRNKKKEQAKDAGQKALGKVPLVEEPLDVVVADDTNTTVICNAPPLLQALKIWCDWLLCNEHLWNNPEHTDKYTLQKWSSYDPWPLLATLLNQLSKIDVNWLRASSKQKEGYTQGRLPEDIHMAGFMPLAEAITPTYLPIAVEADMGTEDGRAEHTLRVYKILQFGQWVSGRKPSVLRLHSSGSDTQFTCVMLPAPSDDDGGQQRGVGGVNEMIAAEQQRSSNDGEKPGDEEMPRDWQQQQQQQQQQVQVLRDNNAPRETTLLASRVKELKQQQKFREKHEQRRKQLLQPSAINLLMEVRPKYLVPDTNCFVDDLGCIKAIASATQLFTLMVPIVVVSELRGLSMGAKNRPGKLPALHMAASASRPGLIQPVALQHSYTVTQNAALALEYLESVAHGNVMFVTTKGNAIRRIIFATEDDEDGQRTNDDRILEAALNLIGTSSSVSASSAGQQAVGEPKKILREVVLLTKDRNLRVKALSHNVPVREMHDFAQWAHLPVNVEQQP